MDALDNVAALAYLAQCRLCRLGDKPLSGSHLTRETERFEFAQSCDFQGVELIG